MPGTLFELRAMGLPPEDVCLDGLFQSHARSPGSQSATSRSVLRSILAYTAVAEGLR